MKYLINGLAHQSPQADDWKAITAAVLAFARAEPDSDEQGQLYRATRRCHVG
ncbi:hypothetical protein ACFWWT_46790 [Streptomyces sp. NPDC058676]|uniref:hypothetical protein n=1 Tax=unclassified Streptomyces TaxID=2593676 RepID=UPI00366590AB